jgi:4-amino-4-deoxy-L-arabinose transferase-like glycosyltransferase
VIAIRALKALARGWWTLPLLLHGVALIAICFLVDTGIGNATVAESMLGVAVVGVLSLTFVWLEGWQRRIQGNRSH